MVDIVRKFIMFNFKHLLYATLVILCFSSSIAVAADGANNSPETALSITPVQTVNTSIDYQGDEDWFAITVDHTCSIVSSITNNSGIINYNLYNASLTNLSSSLYFSTAANNSWKVTPGTYYIKINAYSSVNYSISNISLTVNIREPDDYEDNDQPVNAVVITPDQIINGIAVEARNDNDWFSVTVDHTCSIVSTITNNSGYITYGLYDAGLTNLSGINYIGAATAKHAWKVTPGTYYIKISEYSGTRAVNYLTSNISLSVSLREQDAHENNDQTVNAVAITPDQTINGIAVEAWNDNDWVSITVDQTCSIVSTITNNSGYITYGIYNSSLTYLSGINFIGTGTAYHAWKVTPGTYYIKISEYSNERAVNYFTSNISLTVNLREQDAYENNDIAGNAVELTPGQTLSNIGIEAPNDVDWFKIDVDHTCSIIGELSSQNGAIIYTLYNSSFNQLLSQQNSTYPKFTYKVEPGTYYIKLNQYYFIDYRAISVSLKVSLSKEYDFSLTLGNPTWCDEVAEPVNIINGNYYSEDNDLSIPTRTVPLEFIRYYNSRFTDSSPLGKGWQHNYNSYLKINTDNYVDVTYGDGHSSLFTLSNGVYTRQAGVFETLVKNTDGTYTLTFKSQLKYNYNSSGKLTSIVDKNNNITMLQYTNSLLSSVTEPAGRTLQFSYNTNNKLTQVTDPLCRTLVFTYDLNGNLITVKDLNDEITTYAYNNFGIETVTDPKNHIVVKNTYDTNSKIIEQEDGKGQKSYMSYDPVLRKNTFTDTLGNVTTYNYDSKYRQTKILYPDQTYTLYTYDSDYNKLTETDPRGNTTTFTYDSSGNLLTQTAPSTLGFVTTYIYDSKNNLTSVTDAAGHTTTYTYDANGNLLQNSKAIGEQTAAITYTYNQYGQVNTITNANDKTSQLTYNQYGDVLQTINANGIAMTYNYDLAGRKLTRTNAQNQTWTFTYDNAGNVLTETDPLNGVVTNRYDANGNLQSKTDPGNKTVTNSYDENDHLVQITDQMGQINTIVYDANGNKTALTDANGHTTTYTYDSRNRLASITDAEGATINYTRDANGNMLTKTDGNGKKTLYEYDALNRLVKITDPLNNTTQFQYDALGNVLSQTDSKGQSTNYSYNEDSRLITITDPLNNTSAYSYDLVGNKISVTDARDKTSTYTYDNINQLLKVTDPTGHFMRMTYDSSGNVISKTDENDHETVYTFDALGRITAVTDPLGNMTSYSYDANGNVITVCDANNQVTTYTYDGLSRLVTKTDAQSHSTNYTYDAVGNKLSVTDAMGQTSSYTYNDVNRLTKITDPLNHETQVVYDANGNILSKIDANGWGTQFSYDECGRMISATDALGITTFYSYDANGNLQKVTDARGKERTFEFDAQNRLIKETDPLNNERTWLYDAAGNLIIRTKPGGININYTYDDNNRLTRITYPDQSQVSYTYDFSGKRVSMADPNGSTTYTYDESDRLKTVTRDNETITYQYDAAGNITKVTYPDGMQADYGYNSLNKIQTATVNGHTMGIEYNELGQRTQENMPNGIVTTYQYDQNSRLTLLKHQLGETVLASTAYELDNNGNRLSITNENNQITSFSYDPLGQLTQVTYPDGKSAQYTYDTVGNRLMTGGDALDQLSEVTGTINLSYDYEDRLTEFQDGTKTIHYTYDGDGNLIKKTISGSQTAQYEYLYDYSAGLPRLLVEKNGANTYNYIYANRLYSRIGPDGEIYYHQDGQGSTLVITDDTGAVKNRYQYDAFGNPTTLQQAVENSILFTGELYDQSGYIYLRARYYDPAAGRFITQDSQAGNLYNPLTQNLYAYCGNNPVNYIDPSGNSRCSIDETTKYVSQKSSSPSFKRMGIIEWLQMLIEQMQEMYRQRELLELQDKLSYIGMVPIIGEPADALNAFIYMARGDTLNAGLCAFAITPGLGSISTGGKIIAKKADEITDFVQGAGNTTSLTKWGPVHGRGNMLHNNVIENELDWADNQGASLIKKNKIQVDVNGNRVSSNRPDAAYSLNGTRYNTNYISNYELNNLNELNRELQNFNRIVNSDRNAVTYLVFKYVTNK